MPTFLQKTSTFLRDFFLANMGMFVVISLVFSIVWYLFTPTTVFLSGQALERGYCSSVWIEEAIWCEFQIDTITFLSLVVIGFVIGGFLLKKLKQFFPAMTTTFKQAFVATCAYPVILFLQHVIASMGAQYDWEKQAAAQRVFSWMGISLVAITLVLIAFNMHFYFKKKNQKRA